MLAFKTVVSLFFRNGSGGFLSCPRFCNEDSDHVRNVDPLHAISVDVHVASILETTNEIL